MMFMCNKDETHRQMFIHYHAPHYYSNKVACEDKGRGRNYKYGTDYYIGRESVLVQRFRCST